jgi:hypothetical protein
MTEPTFEQSVPPDGNWALVGPYDKRSGQLAYQNESGEQIAVPNVWYNQPVEARIEAMEWYAARHDECEATCLAEAERFPSNRKLRLEQAEQARRCAKRLRHLADEMRRTGKVLA